MSSRKENSPLPGTSAQPSSSSLNGDPPSLQREGSRPRSRRSGQESGSPKRHRNSSGSASIQQETLSPDSKLVPESGTHKRHRNSSGPASIQMGASSPDSELTPDSGSTKHHLNSANAASVLQNVFLPDLYPESDFPDHNIAGPSIERNVFLPCSEWMAESGYSNRSRHSSGESTSSHQSDGSSEAELISVLEHAERRKNLALTSSKQFFSRTSDTDRSAKQSQVQNYEYSQSSASANLASNDASLLSPTASSDTNLTHEQLRQMNQNVTKFAFFPSPVSPIKTPTPPNTIRVIKVSPDDQSGASGGHPSMFRPIKESPDAQGRGSGASRYPLSPLSEQRQREFEMLDKDLECSSQDELSPEMKPISPKRRSPIVKRKSPSKSPSPSKGSKQLRM